MTEKDIELCRAVFGSEWEQCVTPRGRKELQRRVEAGEVAIRTDDDVSRPDQEDAPTIEGESVPSSVDPDIPPVGKRDDEGEDEDENDRLPRYGQYSEDEIQEGERYRQDPITDDWYLVTEWVERPDDRVIAVSKTEVDESEVPGEVMPDA